LRLNSKRKGCQGEREAALFMTQQWGIQARRGQQFKGGQDSPDVVQSIKGLHFEIKRVEKLNLVEAMAQAIRDAGSNIPIVMHRRNRSPWLLTIHAEDLIPFCSRIMNQFEQGGA
jgi:hypothetical protein